MTLTTLAMSFRERAEWNFHTAGSVMGMAPVLSSSNDAGDALIRMVKMIFAFGKDFCF